MRRRGQQIVLISASLCAWLSSACTVSAHPYHVTLSESSYNEETQMLETALRVTPADLELALELRTGEPVDLEKTENVDALILEYLTDTFLARTGSVDEAKSTTEHAITWVGKEVFVKTAWLYFEMSMPNGVDGVSFSNQMFLELDESQANTMNLRVGEYRTSMTFSLESLWHTVELPEGD